MTTKRTHDSQLKTLVYKAPSTIHGTGLFAAQGFKDDSYIGTYAGPIARRNGRYVLWVTDEDGSETGVRGLNLLRYLNHADKPNAYFDGVDLFAARRIKADSEITFDYGWGEA
jgi:uncharacterized protein